MKMQEVEREYQCCNVRCRHRFLVKSDPEQGNVMEIPVREQKEIAAAAASACVLDAVEDRRS